MENPQETFLSPSWCTFDRCFLSPRNKFTRSRLFKRRLLHLRTPRIHSTSISQHFQTSYIHHLNEHIRRVDIHREFPIRSTASLGMAKRELHPSSTRSF